MTLWNIMIYATDVIFITLLTVGVIFQSKFRYFCELHVLMYAKNGLVLMVNSVHKPNLYQWFLNPVLKVLQLYTSRV